jgi:hypothetical protein
MIVSDPRTRFAAGPPMAAPACESNWPCRGTFTQYARQVIGFNGLGPPTFPPGNADLNNLAYSLDTPNAPFYSWNPATSQWTAVVVPTSGSVNGTSGTVDPTFAPVGVLFWIYKNVTTGQLWTWDPVNLWQ